MRKVRALEDPHKVRAFERRSYESNRVRGDVTEVKHNCMKLVAAVGSLSKITSMKEV
jgi:hypothetical protein